LNSFQEWVQQLNFEGLWELLITVAASLLCITVHECSHGLAALWMGDDTARRQGRLSLNPLRHVDLMGLIVMAIARFGWAKAVPVNMRKFRYPKLGMAVTALAGPLSNVILMSMALVLRAVLLALYYLNGVFAYQYLILFFEYTAVLSAGLAVFNLFPIPPLDGSKILFCILPDRTYQKLLRYEHFGMILLAALLIIGLLDVPLQFLRGGLISVGNQLAAPVFEFTMSFIG